MRTINLLPTACVSNPNLSGQFRIAPEFAPDLGLPVWQLRDLRRLATAVQRGARPASIAWARDWCLRKNSYAKARVPPAFDTRIRFYGHALEIPRPHPT